MTFLADNVGVTTELELIRSAVEVESGLFFDADRYETLRRGVRERMEQCKVATVAEYLALLHGPLELRALIERLTIGETYFFRNEPQFAALRERILPALIERRLADRHITLWSAACSTGEEPYSLAMLLWELLPEPTTWRISLLSTDVNSDHLRRAQRAVYGSRAVRLVPPAWRAKYFREQQGEFQLCDEIKNLVQFVNHNVVKEPLTQPGMSNVDLLFCRNVTIYFTLDTTRRVMERLADCLAADGYLFIGDAETLWQICDRFTPVEFQDTFVYRRADFPVLPKVRSFQPRVSLPQECAVPVASPPPPPTAPRPAPLSEAASRLQQAVSHVNQEQWDTAIIELRAILAADNLASDAYYLLGTVYARRGDATSALANFQRAVYVNSTLALAHYAMGQLYQSQSRPDRARRAFQNAVRALVGRPDEELVQLSEDITCGRLRTVCQQQSQEGHQ